MKKPTIRPLQAHGKENTSSVGSAHPSQAMSVGLKPPTAQQNTPSSRPGIQCNAFIQRSSGNLTKSRMEPHWVSSCFSETIQPTCDHQKLWAIGECGSMSVSEYL